MATGARRIGPGGVDGPKRRALLIAADQYEAADLSELRSPAHDVEALASALSEAQIGDFQVSRIFNKPAHEVNAAIEDLFCDRQPDDVLLLYVSCHGVKDDAGRLYFATTNTRINRLGSTAVASTFVGEQMARSMSRNIILLLDCCYSGAFVEGMVMRGDGGGGGGGGGVGITERLSGSGRAILSSSSALEYSFELDERHVTREISMEAAGRERRGRPSIFTAALVDGLTSGEADYNGDGRISVDELYDYAYSKVTAENPKQTPTKFSDVSGELIVAYSPRTARPPELPEEVASAASHPLHSVRLAAVDLLRDLALAGDEVGRLAYERLGMMLQDDSRSVTAKARLAMAEIERAGVGASRVETPAPPWQPPARSPSSFRPHPGGMVTPPPARPEVPPMPWPSPVPPVPFAPPRGEPQRQNAQWPPQPDEPLRGASVLAYFMPFFGSLLLLFSKNRNVKYHAVHCALIDAMVTVYLIFSIIPMGIYSTNRYGDEEVPAGDLAMNIWMVVLFALPLGLRGYCLIQLIRKGTARVVFAGSLARRVVRPHGRGR
ncbi:hypothetical protein GCM10022254_42120 [Actinomadura meridiana]|uniref:Peptidase C14 caspase domain-containing protein n=1 Tax=Actinomadura meridiana TaxID=559626 RepID=A0ABP8C7W4_9ACTN